jgi:hypothetical protein
MFGNPYRQHKIIIFEAVKKYKSVFRAMRRGKVSVDGTLFPLRPFNNRKNTSKRTLIDSREINSRKQKIYGEAKQFIV